MDAKLLIAATLVAVALAGNAQAQSRPPGSYNRCLGSQASCVVTVTVPASCTGCVPAANPEYVGIEKGKKIRVSWRLGTANYAFDEKNGIVFPEDPNGEVFKCRAEQNATVYVCDNTHAISGKTYKYTVNVTGPGAPKPLDPWVINE